MKNLTLSVIAECTKGSLHIQGKADKEVTWVGIDSRKLIPGGLFIATKGERVDGHTFIEQVYKNGAAAVVCEKAPENEEIPYILVEDSLQALKDIAEFYRQHLAIKVVGITGSVGKTSTKEFIAGVLEQKYKVHKTAGNFNNEVGLPLTVLQIRDEEIAVLEMGISNFGEMHRLSKIARPDVCVMTNIGQCHLEFLGSREGILKAKSEIFDFACETAAVFVNGDDDMLATIGKKTKGETLHYGLSSENDVYAKEIENLGLFGSRCKICFSFEKQEFGVEIPLPGEHMVYNALAAAGVAKFYGLSTEQIARGIASVKPVDGRSNIIRTEKYTVIDDCYNANPVSMKAAIDLLGTALGRKVAVLGDMFELGENERKLHEEVGVYAATKKIDVLLCVGRLCEYMAEAAEKNKEGSAPKVYYFPEREMLENKLSELLKDGDTVLVKASHGMGFADIVKELV